MNTLDLRGKRADTIKEARRIYETAEAEKRDPTAEESQRFDALMSDAEAQKRNIERLESLEREEAGISALPESRGRAPLPEAPSEPKQGSYEDVFWRWVRHGKSALDPSEVRTLRAGYEPGDNEQRTQSLTVGAGGYTVPSNGVFPTLLDAARRNTNIMRSVATIQQADFNTNVATVSAHGAAAWTAETIGYTAADETTGQVTFSAYKATSLVKISEELLQDSIFDMSGYLAAELGKRIGVLEETGFVAGTGSTQPTGIVGGAGAGISAAAATAITTDELLGLLHAVDRPYRNAPSAGWMFADSTALYIRKLKDASGQYIWQPGLQADQPDRLLGKPVYISDNVPAIATGNKSVLFGELATYWIVDRAGIFVQRLDELYAENGLVGFRAFLRTDGKLTDASAVKRIVQA